MGMSMRDAVIVSTARTPSGRAYRGAFSAGLAGDEIDDVLLGCAMA